MLFFADEAAPFAKGGTTQVVDPSGELYDSKE
jgi:hypothetical protein